MHCAIRLDLARHVEALGYQRFWLAEHHNMSGIASAATVVVIGHVAAGTRRIRVGSGGIMLPNHAPLVVAEQFGTLATLFPERIDLGLGRAPGTDMLTARALRRDLATSAETFSAGCPGTAGLFRAQQSRAGGSAPFPGRALRVPLWILGSSLFGASWPRRSACRSPSPRTFAPDALMPALEIYRSRFKPSRQLQRPCHGGREHRRGGFRRGGALSVHLAAAGFCAPNRSAPARKHGASLQNNKLRARPLMTRLADGM